MTFKEKWNDAWEGFQAGKWNKEVNPSLVVNTMFF